MRLPGVVPRAVALSPEQRAELERRASGRMIAHQEVLRARILLALSQPDGPAAGSCARQRPRQRGGPAVSARPRAAALKAGSTARRRAEARCAGVAPSPVFGGPSALPSASRTGRCPFGRWGQPVGLRSKAPTDATTSRTPASSTSSRRRLRRFAGVRCPLPGGCTAASGRANGSWPCHLTSTNDRGHLTAG